MTSPVKVCCPVHGMVALTPEQYRLQLDRPETPWFCPQCLATAVLVAGTTRADAADPQPETCDWSWENRNRTGGDHTCKRAIGHSGPHLCNCGAADDVPVPTLPPDPHRQRHVELHQAFEELLSDYLTQNPKAYPSKTPLLDLLRWSHEQSLVPTDPPG